MVFYDGLTFLHRKTKKKHEILRLFIKFKPNICFKRIDWWDIQPNFKIFTCIQASRHGSEGGRRPSERTESLTPSLKDFHPHPQRFSPMPRWFYTHWLNISPTLTLTHPATVVIVLLFFLYTRDEEELAVAIMRVQAENTTSLMKHTYMSIHQRYPSFLCVEKDTNSRFA